MYWIAFHVERAKGVVQIESMGQDSLFAAAGELRYHLQDHLGIIRWDGGFLLYSTGAGGCLLSVILSRTCVYVMASSCD
jgi:hypothetical protein